MRVLPSCNILLNYTVMDHFSGQQQQQYGAPPPQHLSFGEYNPGFSDGPPQHNQYAVRHNYPSNTGERSYPPPSAYTPQMYRLPAQGMIFLSSRYVFN